jgi:hypothetical protein
VTRKVYLPPFLFGAHRVRQATGVGQDFGIALIRRCHSGEISLFESAVF